MEEQEETIKPVVRMEGTKVYARKNIPEKPKMTPIIKPPEVEMAPLEQITQPQLTTLENLGLTKQAVNALPNKRYVDMKIGDKTVRVQKLMMTRAEIEAMAREGKIEMKGNTILLKNPRTNMPDKTVKSPIETDQKSVPKGINLQSIIGDPKPVATAPKPIFKKTYIRKMPTQVGEGNATAVKEIQGHTTAAVPGDPNTQLIINTKLEPLRSESDSQETP